MSLHENNNEDDGYRARRKIRKEKRRREREDAEEEEEKTKRIKSEIELFGYVSDSESIMPDFYPIQVFVF